jgi:hypothetical protein
MVAAIVSVMNVSPKVFAGDIIRIASQPLRKADFATKSAVFRRAAME